MTKYKDLTGKKFGRLVALEETSEKIYTKTGNIREGITYKCQCECGNIKISLGSELYNGVVKSCGCLQVGGHNKKDLTGKMFGKLLVLEAIDNNKDTNALWKCQCECGNITNVIGSSLRNGTKSCGCLARMNEKFDHIGQTFGRLLVIDRLSNTTRGMAVWKCQCECGNIINVRGYDLRSNRKKSCGCLQKETKSVWKGVGEMKGSYYSKTKKGAALRGFEFSISKRYMYMIYLRQDKKCALTKIPISFIDNTASIDRIDSSLGYIENNVQWVHKDINRIKMDLDQSYFIKLCKMVSENAITSDR